MSMGDEENVADSTDGTLRLTRRDALIALSALGAGATITGTYRNRVAGGIDEERMERRLLAVAEAIYPPEVEVTDDFVSTYVTGRLHRREQYLQAQASALHDLDIHARRHAGRSFDSLSTNRRLDVLEQMGVHRSHPNPEGTREERIRYFVVNDLLYALFSTPVGGELVGCENPPGFPGGREAYQRGPNE